MKYIFAVFLLAFSVAAYAAGAASDIPFVLSGQLHIVDSNFSAEQYPVTSCEVTLPGRTNARNSPASITSIRYSGDESCVAWIEQYNGNYTETYGLTSMTWVAGSPSDIKISNIAFETKSSYCVGDIIAKKIEDRLMVFQQKMGGTCTVSGSLKIVSTPALY
jgi:hypothetical protein